MSCYDCKHNQPQGCIKSRPEYETMTECPEYEIDVTAIIVELRGGVPEICDYCSQEFNAERRAVPDEAGTWSCTECWDRWDNQEKGESDGMVNRI